MNSQFKRYKYTHIKDIQSDPFTTGEVGELAAGDNPQDKIRTEEMAK